MGTRSTNEGARFDFTFFLEVHYKMATAKQKAAARRNIKKAQAKWKKMSRRARAKAMPGGRGPIRKRRK